MRPEAALLLAVIATAVAVAALVGAILLLIVVRGMQQRTRHASIELVEVAVNVRRTSGLAREGLGRARSRMERLRGPLQTMETGMEESITAMRRQRADIEHGHRRRLIPAVRLFRVAGIAARVAVLWR